MGFALFKMAHTTPSQQTNDNMGKLGRLETEDVPANKKFHASTRENSEYKWQTRGVVGAYEVASEPDLDYREELTPHDAKSDDRDAFLRAREAFESLNLRESFISACDSVPKDTCCCGLVPDPDSTKKDLVAHCNKTWVKSANEKLAPYNIKVDTYLWEWSNISGKSESVIILIRFFDIAQ